MQQVHNIKAAGLMVLGMLLISSNDVIVKLSSERFSVVQILAWRGCLAVIIFAGFIALSRQPIMPRAALTGWNLLRALCEIGATLCFVTGLSLLPIATASTLVWISPVLVTICAALILRETVTLGRWSAVLVGFIGVLLVANPYGETFQWAMALPVSAALFIALREMVTRKIPAQVASMHITLVTLIAVTVTGGVLSFDHWQPVTLTDTAKLAVSAVLLSSSFFCQISAVRLGELSFIAPFSFSGILVAVGYGYFIWSDWPSWNMFVGIALIMAAGLYLMVRKSTVAGSRQAAD